MSNSSNEANTVEAVINNRVSKRLTRDEWAAILEEKDREGLTATEIANKYDVQINNVYQWASKLKSEATPKAAAKDKDLIKEAKKMQKGIAEELKAFDKQIEDAKNLIANAVAERKKIEDKEAKYQTVIDLFS